jgi:malate synthase
MTLSAIALSSRGVTVTGPDGPRFSEILTPDAIAFVAELHRRFDAARLSLLADRAAQQARFDRGELPDFLPSTKAIREAEWRVAPVPEEINDRRVEIAGPADRKTLLNGLNSRARVCMADFEDALAPTWSNLIEGQLNICDRWHDRLDYVDLVTGGQLKLSDHPAVLMTRPRGLHLPEAHMQVDGEEVAGAFFDFGLTLFHNVEAMLAKGSRPYFYIAKLKTHFEARLWNDVFVYAQERLGVPVGTIKATVLIETLSAAFAMDEIIYELRDHMAGLNCGRWDYIFSLIKTFRTNPAYLLPDRDQVDMGDAFLRAYSELLIKTCHRRGTFALGGLSAFLPADADTETRERVLTEIIADKEREARAGHDGTWVAHPDLVPVAKAVFDRLVPGPNQINVLREDVNVGQDELLEVHDGFRTTEGLRNNIRSGIQYLEAWLSGNGAVPLGNELEDAAIAEISRAQVWQQIRFRASYSDGRKATPELFEFFLAEEMERVRSEIGAEAFDKGRFQDAIALFRKLSLALELEPFFTVPAYRLIV